MAAINSWRIEAAMGHQHSLEEQAYEKHHVNQKIRGNEDDRLVETRLE